MFEDFDISILADASITKQELLRKISTEQQRSKLRITRFVYCTFGKIVTFFVSCVFLVIPHRDRVRVIVADVNGRILLVKGLFSRQQWALPGGSLKRDETYQQAAKREVFEEVGLRIDKLKYIGHTYSYESFWMFPVRVYLARVNNSGQEKLNFEILESAWLHEDKLPREYRLLYSKVSSVE